METSVEESREHHDSGEVEVEKADLSEAIELPPDSEAVDVEKEAESSSVVPEDQEQKMEEEVAADSLDAELSVHPSNAGVGGGVPAQVYEIPRCGEDQPSMRASWMNCCGLLDVVRGSNQ